jgi:acyl-CoA thioesterase FadM
LSAEYRRRTGCALYTVEMTIRFLAEVKVGERLSAESLVDSYDAKRLQLRTTVRNAAGGAVAEGESLYLHVNAAGNGRVCPFPADRAAWLATVAGVHATTGDAHQPETSAR